MLLGGGKYKKISLRPNFGPLFSTAVVAIDVEFQCRYARLISLVR